MVRGFVVRDDTATFTLREDDSQRNVLDNVDESPVWNLWLSKATPLRLTLETGVGESTIDLSQLHVTVSRSQERRWSDHRDAAPSGRMRAELSGGIGSTTVVIPAGVPVRVESSVGLGNIIVPSTYLQQGEAYVSPEATTAVGQIELTVNGGIGGITIKLSGE